MVDSTYIMPKLMLPRITSFSRWSIWSFHMKIHGKMAKKKSTKTPEADNTLG